MQTLVYPLSGNTVTLHINRRAKKNIILRPHSKSSLHISIPPWLSQNRLQQWLRANEPLLAQMLAKAACTPPNGKLAAHRHRIKRTGTREIDGDGG